MTEENKNKKKTVFWFITGGFILLGALIFFLWLFIFRFEEATEDAYVHGNQVVLTSQIPGFINSVSVDETEFVRQGRVIVELDTTDQKLHFESAKNILAETVRDVTRLFENVGKLKADLEMRKAEFTKAGQDYEHRKKLISSGSVSLEELEHAKAAFIAAFAAVLGTQHELRSAIAMVENTEIPTHPIVEKAKDHLKEAYVNLQRCTIKAPVDGIIAMKKAQVGEAIDPNTPLMTIVPLNQIWVNANFKEVQLKNVRLGQPVEMIADIYGHSVKYRGEVIGISAGTGNVFSVLPPQNATGNWIKIVQRLPVRVNLKEEDLKKHPLRLGLSMKVKVDIHDTSGKMIPKAPPPGALYSTDVFSKQEEGVNKIIEQIVKENMTFNEKGDESRE